MACNKSLLLAGAMAFCLAGTGALRAADSAGPATVATASAARLTAGAEKIRLEVDFDHSAAFTTHYVDSPPRLLLDFPGAIFSIPENAIKAGGLVKSVRYGAMAKGQARMVVTLAHPVRIARAEMTARSAGGSTLVLEGERVNAAEYRKLVAGQNWETALTPTAETPAPAAEPPADPTLPADPSQGPFLVAIDAGHGGIDTGATGADGKTLEKDITLAFARTLAEDLNREPGVQAFLIRDKDEFLSLTERVDRARQRKANLFISFHADTLNQDDIRGATVYTISDTASDKLAASIAARENFSDELAGVKLEAEPGEVSDILLDLTRRETQAFSVTFAQSVIQSFKGQIGLINNPHRSAGFRVLRAPDIPSILLELGFLSNPKDEAQLQDPAWRDKIASLVTEAVRRYRSPDAAAGKGNGG